MKEELRQLLVLHQQNETKDSSDYEKLAQVAEEAGCDEIAGVLRDIAEEERSHRCLLVEMANWLAK